MTQSPATLISGVVAAACLFWCLAVAALDNGVDAANLGKGDWLWVLSDCESNIGAPGNLQALIDFERARGMRWLVVKSSDGGQVWSQFNSDLVTRCHNAGLKVFSFGYVYGGSSSQVQYEINAAVTAMGIKDSHNVPMDGFIIDAEIEFNAAGQDAYAAQYCQGVRAQFPSRFLAHSPYPIPSWNTSGAGFPYATFGRYCDAVMPQAYWYDQFSGSGGVTPEYMVQVMTSDWVSTYQTWQNNGNAASIKPLAPIGQGFQGQSSVPIPGSELVRFVDALNGASTSSLTGSYRGVSFFTGEWHTTDMWNALAAVKIGPVVPYYWDLNGSVAGSGGPSPAGAWDGTSAAWSTNGAGTGATTDWADYNDAHFSAGTDATASYTITNTTAKYVSGFFFDSGNPTLTGPGVFTFSADGDAFYVAANVTATVSAPLAGAYGYLNKTGPGKLALTGTNTFSNGVTLETGTLAIGNPAALGTGALDIEHVSGVSVVQAMGNQTVTNALYFGADVFSIGGSNDLTFSGPIDLGSSQYAPTIVTVTNTGTSAFSGTLTNTTGFVKAGTGTLVLSGARANTYGSTAANGTTTVNGGTLKLSKTTGLAAVPNGSLVVNAGGTLLLGAANQIADSVPLTLAGGVFQSGGFGEQLGTLKVTANSLIDLGSGMSLLAFANSSGVPWTGGALLMVSNWAGSIGGGGQTRVVFGGNNSGLTAVQVSQIRFANPLGFPPGAWTATILSTGETVPLTAAPAIGMQPQDRIAVVGDSVSFTCAATGIPPSVWQWRCSGTNVPGAMGATLFLPNVALSQAGTYAVAVTNIAGSSISSNAVLSVYSSAVPTLSGASVAGNRQFQLGLTGVPGYNYAIWVSTNLSDWAWLQTTSAPFTFTDTNISGFKCRFYRAQYVP